ncbi:hypothetical protein LCGC14_0371950 [marine sediment metagenome]|uniref:Uncharacterized protein n=1 Tax=marine sediment metagenome TaxID=412755 RepID=A0A0F9WDQ0_9ZZZZ
MLVCILCGRTVIMNNNPMRYSVCTHCDVSNLTEEQRKIITNARLTEHMIAIGVGSFDIGKATEAQKQAIYKILKDEVDQDANK